MSTPTRKQIEAAYGEAVRSSARLSLMGALGFGVALVMGAQLAIGGGFFSMAFALEMILFVGGLAGGLSFTVLAVRASRMARECQRRLERTTAS